MKNKNPRPVAKSKPSKKKKGDLLFELMFTMTEEQWQLIEKLKGHKIGATNTARLNFLGKIFHKTRKLSTRKAIARECQKIACQITSEIIDIPWGKDEAIDSRGMGQSGPDVIMSKKVRIAFPFTWECKSGTINLKSAIAQAKANRYPDTNWLVMFNDPNPRLDKRLTPVVIMDADVFKSLCLNSKPVLVEVKE